MKIPLITTLTAAQAAVNGIRWLGKKDLRVWSLQKHYTVGAMGLRYIEENAKGDRIVPFPFLI